VKNFLKYNIFTICKIFQEENMQISLNLTHCLSSRNQKNRKILAALIGVLATLIFGLSACGPTPAQLAAFQTVTAMAAFTATPTASPTPAGITADQDLAALINSAADGDVITLAPGTFILTQGMEITKSLTLVGAGTDQTIIQAEQPATDYKAMLIYSGTGTLTLQGLSLEYTGSKPAAVLYVKSGALGLDQCRLTGASVSEKGTQLGAIQLANDSIAIIRNSAILGSVDRMDPNNPQKIPGGILVSGTVNLTVENSQVSDSYLGVYAFGNAVVTLTNNQFSNNYSAVSLLENASGTMTNNTLAGIDGTQIALFNNAKLTATGNTLTNSSDGIGMQVNGSADVDFEKNTLEGGMNGIYFGDQSTGKIVSNKISASSNVGVYVKGSSVVTLDSNILLNCQIGISFEEQSGGSITNNEIQLSQIAVTISSPANPSVIGNTLQGEMIALSFDPKDWSSQVDAHDNSLTDGPPVITIVTFTPTPQP
jgi:parallel beta-helix repeat protein